MKKALLFITLMLVVAVWLSAMVCVLMGAEVSPQWLSLVEPFVCPPGTEIQVAQTRQSYHEPGESSVKVSCVGESIDQDVTIESGLALWVIFFLPSLPVAAILVFVGWLLFRMRRRAVLEQASAPVNEQVIGTVIVDGQSYASVDDMPAHVQEAYRKAVSALGDANGDGVPDILQGQMQTGAGMQRLNQLKQMLDAGLITLNEYEEKKAEILSRL
jgi:hypothetical protein